MPANPTQEDVRHLPLLLSTDADKAEVVDGMMETLVVPDGDTRAFLLTSYSIKKLHERCVALGWF